MEWEALVNAWVRSGVTRVKITGGVNTERGEGGRRTPSGQVAPPLCSPWGRLRTGRSPAPVQRGTGPLALDHLHGAVGAHGPSMNEPRAATSSSEKVDRLSVF